MINIFMLSVQTAKAIKLQKFKVINYQDKTLLNFHEKNYFNSSKFHMRKNFNLISFFKICL